jgi:hypothetical protein
VKDSIGPVRYRELSGYRGRPGFSPLWPWFPFRNIGQNEAILLRGRNLLLGFWSITTGQPQNLGPDV